MDLHRTHGQCFSQIEVFRVVQTENTTDVGRLCLLAAEAAMRASTHCGAPFVYSPTTVGS
jgi:hypothetical protein